MKTGTLAVVLTLVACAAPALAQDRAGLWETSTTLKWDKLPVPPEMMERLKQMPNNPFESKMVTSMSCVTQQQIDKGMSPHNTPRSCEVQNFTKTSDGMTADIVCTGQFQGKGTFGTHRIDSDSYKIHGEFSGTTGRGGDAQWTLDGKARFVSKDCGGIAPGEAKVVN